MRIAKIKSKSCLRRAWQTRWLQSKEYRQTKLWLPNLRDITGALLSRDRSSVGQIVQAITGFNNLAYHTKNKGEFDDDSCRLCLEDREEFWHIASQCPAVASNWVSIFGPSGPIPEIWQIHDIERLIAIPEVEEILLERPE